MRLALGDTAFQIEHIGSTAIEGMKAKPLIDLMVAVADLEEAKAYVPQLELLGYEFRPGASGPDRLFLAKGPHDNRTHHLSLTDLGSKFHRESLFFRDYLRTHPDAAQEYRKLKEVLAQQYSEDRGAYTDGKKGFIEKVLKLAEAIK